MSCGCTGATTGTYLASMSTRVQAVKAKVKSMPAAGPALVRALAAVRVRRFPGSESYWEDRYASGGTSGSGSYGQLAGFKATVNEIVAEKQVESVLEEMHLRHVFGASRRIVVNYAADQDLDRVGGLQLHRRFTPWIEVNLPAWRLVGRIDNPHVYDPARPDEGSLANFFIYERSGEQP